MSSATMPAKAVAGCACIVASDAHAALASTICVNQNEM
jgi:hypothetical protein